MKKVHRLYVCNHIGKTCFSVGGQGGTEYSFPFLPQHKLIFRSLLFSFPLLYSLKVKTLLSITDGQNTVCRRSQAFGVPINDVNRTRMQKIDQGAFQLSGV